ncbi:MAG: methionyl-tRNA formyltransferase [Kiloniellales bacterium]
MGSPEQEDRLSPRWAFAGCKPQAIAVLEALAGAGFLPAFVAWPEGALEDDSATLIDWATAKGVPVHGSKGLEESQIGLSKLDLLLVCRFNLLQQQVYSAPRLGSVNIHSSLLPAYRGVHPVSWAMINGERETGVTVHSIDAGVDTGRILRQAAIPIEDRHDLWTLTRDLDRLSARVALDLFGELSANGRLPVGRSQNGHHSYARRRGPDDSRIEWSGPARGVFNLVRALPPPMPPAFTERRDGARVPVLACAADPREGQRGTAPGTVLGYDRGGAAVVQCGGGEAAAIRCEPSLTSGERLA